MSSGAEVFVPFDFIVMEPADDWHYNGNSPFCKDNFKKRQAPCLVIDEYTYLADYSTSALKEKTYKVYFGDKLEPGTYFYKDGQFVKIEI